MPFSLSASGSYSQTTRYLQKLSQLNAKAILERYGEAGVQALSEATPRDTGRTAASWYYTVSSQNGSYTIAWHNSNVVEGQKIAILLQYGHGTRNGGYVQGRDYINPACRPIFDQIADEVWRAVNNA